MQLRLCNSNYFRTKPFELEMVRFFVVDDLMKLTFYRCTFIYYVIMDKYTSSMNGFSETRHGIQLINMVGIMKIYSDQSELIKV